MWSLGVLLFEMCHLHFPFDSHDGSKRGLEYEVLNKQPEDLPDCFSKDLNDIMKALLTKDGSKRPTIDQLCNHPLIKYQTQLIY